MIQEWIHDILIIQSIDSLIAIVCIIVGLLSLDSIQACIDRNKSEWIDPETEDYHSERIES